MHDSVRNLLGITIYALYALAVVAVAGWVQGRYESASGSTGFWSRLRAMGGRGRLLIGGLLLVGAAASIAAANWWKLRPIAGQWRNGLMVLTLSQRGDRVSGHGVLEGAPVEVTGTIAGRSFTLKMLAPGSAPMSFVGRVHREELGGRVSDSYGSVGTILTREH